MKKLKWLAKISKVLSILLVVMGIWVMINGKDYLMGFGYIGLAFAISVNDWINLFKKDK